MRKWLLLFIFISFSAYNVSAYTIAPYDNIWMKNFNNPIIGNITANTAQYGDPGAYYENGIAYILVDNLTSGNIELFTDSGGVISKVGIAIAHNTTASNFEFTNVRDPSIIKVGNTYKIYYTGSNSTITGFKIGLATTTNLNSIPYTKYSDQPVFSLEDNGTNEPDVIFNSSDNPKYRMTVTSGKGSVSDVGARNISYAYSNDGISWTYFGNVLTEDATISYQDQFILKIDDVWTMFTNTKDDTRISRYVSTDFTNWTFSKTELAGSNVEYENLVYAPTIIYNGSKYIMYYQTHHNSFVGISKASRKCITDCYQLTNLSVNRGNNTLELNKIPNNYISYYRADGNGLDDNITSMNDVLYVNANASSPGKYGNAFGFQGNGYWIGTLNLLPLISNGSNMTISAWVKPKNLSQTSGVVFITDNTGVSATVKEQGIVQVNQELWAVSQAGTGVQAKANISTYPDQWIHVTAVFKGNNNRTIYINGVNIANDTSIKDTNTSVKKVKIGYRGGNIQYYSGDIDDVRIYNYALDDTDISTIYNNTHITGGNITTNILDAGNGRTWETFVASGNHTSNNVTYVIDVRTSTDNLTWGDWGNSSYNINSVYSIPSNKQTRYVQFKLNMNTSNSEQTDEIINLVATQKSIITTTNKEISDQNTNNFISASITLLIFILLISPVVSRTPKEYKTVLALIIATIGITFLIIYMFI